MNVLLDSTELIDVLREGGVGPGNLRRLLLAGHRLATSAVNVGEVYAGARPKELKDAEYLFGRLEIHPVTHEIGRHAGELRNTAARKGRTLTLDDMIVAATCFAHDCVLLTDNRKDFSEVEGLRLLDLPA